MGQLVKTSGDRCQFTLIRNEENTEALNLAISLLRTGELANMDVNQEARLALSKDEKYIQSILSSAELKKRKKITFDAEAVEQYEQLLLAYD